MAAHVHLQLAMQIVDTLKSICNHDINYIDVNGRICASTDKTRIGNYHEIGHEAAKTGKTILAQEDDILHGTKKGINMPIRFHGETVAVIGITGQPEQVKQYAVLAQRITLLLLREHEMDVRDRNNSSQIHFAVRSLIYDQDINQEFLKEVFSKNKVNIDKAGWKTIIIRPYDQQDQVTPLQLEAAIINTFESIGENLHTFDYPKEYLAIAEAGNLEKNLIHLKKLADRFNQMIKIGIGSTETLRRQYLSARSARIALDSLKGEGNIVFFDELDLQILFTDIAPHVKESYLEKVLGRLSEEDMEVLEVYYDSGMALKKTAQNLYIHQNTLQYKLKKIRDMSGYDPRDFKEAVILYIGLKLSKNAETDRAGH